MSRWASNFKMTDRTGMTGRSFRDPVEIISERMARRKNIERFIEDAKHHRPLSFEKGEKRGCE